MCLFSRRSLSQCECPSWVMVMSSRVEIDAQKRTDATHWKRVDYVVLCSHSPSNASVSSAFAFLHHDTCYPHCVARSNDSTGCHCQIATTEWRIVQRYHAAIVFQLGVDCWHISPTTTNKDALVTFRPLNTSSISKRRERIGLCSVIRHVFGTSYSCYAAENHAVLERITTQ